ncbi:sugar phosphate isomerase/epimerase family protein [Bradyrhizobium sp. 33ap4]|uniref:sugar phosphate isomerase/epimerase family protein n=1 Tax=Bradyrhizobium sp. 33ap4 TaxID=3061630 RepID=UPI0029305EAC|nr:sugar phosphate isomerase/epimerase family protein [Bradyrhizobium sp. 33ap4]
MTKLFFHSFGLRYQYRHKPGFDIFSLIDLAAELGFDGINVSAQLPGYIEISGRERDHLRKVRRHVEDRGLLIDIETRGTEVAHLSDCLAMAADVGAGHLRTYTTGTSDRRQRVAEAKLNLSKIAPMAEQVGIPILLENHEDLCGAEVADILASVNSPWIRALFDYVNSMLFFEHPYESLEAMKPWVTSAHLKDCVLLPPVRQGEGGTMLGVPIGAGITPVAELTEKLASLGIDRISFENTWSYRAPMRDRRSRGEGHESFPQWVDPLDLPADWIVEAAELAESNPTRLLELEMEALHESLRWLRNQSIGAGLTDA